VSVSFQKQKSRDRPPHIILQPDTVEHFSVARQTAILIAMMSKLVRNSLFALILISPRFFVFTEGGKTIRGPSIVERDLAADFCCLCPLPFCFPHEDKIGLILDSEGTECADVQQEIVDFAETDENCVAARTSFSDICCLSQEMHPATSVPVQAPPTVATPQGNEPVCPLCLNDVYPGKPNVFVSSQILDEPKSCGELYDLGLSGHIDAAFCYVLQLFAEDNCCKGPTIAPSTSSSPSMVPSVVPSGFPSVSSEPSPIPTVTCKEPAQECEADAECCEENYVCRWNGFFKACYIDRTSSAQTHEKVKATSNGRVRGQTGSGRGP